MFAVPCSWQPPPDAADAVGANAKTATTAASPVHIDFLDTSTSIIGTRNAVQAPHSSLSPAGSGNRRGGTLTSRASACRLAPGAAAAPASGGEPAHFLRIPTKILPRRSQGKDRC